MESGSEGSAIVLKLSDGEDLVESLKKCVTDKGIKAAMVLSGIGMLREFELGYFDGKGYRNQFYADPWELVGLHGSITTEGGIIVHIHAAVAGKDHRLVGGHVQKAKVNVVNEIILLRLDSLKLARKPDPASGLNLLSVR